MSKLAIINHKDTKYVSLLSVVERGNIVPQIVFY